MYWEIIKRNAEASMANRTTYESLVEAKEYQIIKVTEKSLVIKRMSGGKNISLTKNKVNKVMPILVNSGILKKTGLSNTVALESMIIHLHPSIEWHKESREIHWKKSKAGRIVKHGSSNMKDIEQSIRDADNDTLKKILSWIQQRLHQGEFKKNISKLYNNTCAISGCKVKETLEAAHIEPHSEGGNNRNDNGILLRADLHKLFDQGLLKIDPYKLTIHLSKKIKDAGYKEFEGKKISKTIEDKFPSKTLLKKKWEAK